MYPKDDSANIFSHFPEQNFLVLSSASKITPHLAHNFFIPPPPTNTKHKQYALQVMKL
jgi:hypothetical protein